MKFLYQKINLKMAAICFSLNVLTHKQLETHGCLLRTVATDALVPMHQAISIHNSD